MKYVFEELNHDIEKRDTMIFGEYNKNAYYGGARKFDRLGVDKLTWLIDNDFIEIDERQNMSPSTAEFYEFMQKYPSYKARGYVVDISRSDYRVTIEGLVYDSEEKPSDKAQEEFTQLCRKYDANKVDSYKYCWWD